MFFMENPPFRPSEVERPRITQDRKIGEGDMPPEDLANQRREQLVKEGGVISPPPDGLY